MGRIVGSFGVKGWIKVKPFTASGDALGEFDGWVVREKGGWMLRSLEEFEVHSKGPVGKLAGCDGREAADALRGADVAIPREALGEAGEGAFYQVDLVGFEVVDEREGRLGTVDSFFETGSGSVMVVEGGARSRLVPFVDAYVKAVDRAARRITVDWKAEYDA